MTKSCFSEEGNTYYPHSADNLKVRDRLPPNVFVAKIHPMRGYYLEKSDPFDVPSKLYGTVIRDANRILTTFQDRPASTGVMLSGEAGSGKTMLAKKLSNLGQLMDIPTIIINSQFSGAPFNSFVQGIDQDAIFLFDEFEKVYDDDAQEEILTLLDGTVKTKKLFVFTCNDKWRVNSHMKNRPGRIYYLKEYRGIDEAFIREYANDNLKVELRVHIEALCQFAETFRAFNFDMLKAAVEEMNRYDEGPKDALDMLNARPGYDKNDIKYSLTVQGTGGKKIALKKSTWSGAPLVDDDMSVSLRLWFYNSEKSGTIYSESRDDIVRTAGVPLGEVSCDHFYWSSEDIVGIQPDRSILLENSDGLKLYMSKMKASEVPGIDILF